MISVSVIGHNEERSVRRCLESVRWAGEIVFVDCASTDETARIASEFTGKVYSRENNSNLNVNKQFGIDRCAGEWVLYIDPDEVVTEELKNEIIAAVGRSPSGISGYLIPRKNYYFGRFLRFGGKYPDRQLRLFRKNVGTGAFPTCSKSRIFTVRGKRNSCSRKVRGVRVLCPRLLRNF